MGAQADDPFIAVIVAGGQAVIRSGVRLALEEQPDLCVVGEAADLSSALKQIEAKRPAVAVVDLGLSGGSGVDIVQALAAQKDLEVVYLTSSDDPVLLSAAMRAGARSILSKNAPMSRLLDVIRSVGGASTPRHPELQMAPACDEPAPAQDSAWAALTPREREVAGLVAQGLPYREVAGRLHLSDHTVKNHLRRIYDKLDINSRVELAVHGAGARRA